MTISSETTNVPEHLRVRSIEVSPSTIVEWVKPEPVSQLEARCMELLEPGDLEVYTEKLANFLDEAREIFIRSGVTSMLRSGDLIVAIYTANGDMVHASAGTYLHCVTAMLPVKLVMSRYYADPSVGVRDGDIFYANEARYGGIHNPDQMAFMPVFHEGELIAWTAALSHQPETGACEPGGMPFSARSRHDEGMKLTPIKIGENFRLKNDLVDMMVNFVSRAPRMQAVDTRARVTGADRLRVRLQGMARDRGADFFRGLMRRMVVEGELAARRRISRWNDGTYRAQVFIDTIGREPALVRGVLTATKRGDTITMDLTGSSPENDSSYNCYPHIVAAQSAVYLYAYPFHDLPVTNGTLAAFEWVVPKGTVFNAGDEAAISNSPTLCSLVMSLNAVVFGKLMYDSDDRDKIGAPNGNMGSNLLFSGPNQYGVAVAEVEAATLNTEGQGARPDMDGVHAYGFPWGHAGRCPDTEDAETEYQFIRLFFNLRPDNGGFGKWQGGAGSETAVVPAHVPHMFWSSIGKNSSISNAVGLFGGYPSSASPGIWVTDTDLWEKLARGDKDIPATARDLVTRRAINGSYVFENLNRTVRMSRNGDVIVQFAGGGGGYGDVLERDPRLVVSDTRVGLISEWTCENVFHVRYNRETWEVEENATREARDAERRARLARGRSWSEFHADWARERPTEDALKHFGSWPDGVALKPVIRI
jgi:acetophenone carboxylase